MPMHLTDHLGRGLAAGLVVAAGLVAAGPAAARSHCGSPPDPWGNPGPYASWCRCMGGTYDSSTTQCRVTARPRITRPDPGPTKEELERRKRRERERVQKRIEEEDRKKNKPRHEKWVRDAELEAAEVEARKQQHLIDQRRAQASAAHRNARGNEWNDVAIAAYRGGSTGRALTYFRIAADYLPGDDTIKQNLLKTASRIEDEQRDYLKSVGKVWAIKALSPKLLLFHPDPNVRVKANRDLAKETMKKITEASATFVMNQHLERGKLERFQWETEAERHERRRLADQHARLIEELRLKAFDEAGRRAAALKAVELEAGGPIRLKTGPALRRLMEIGQRGFE